MNRKLIVVIVAAVVAGAGLVLLTQAGLAKLTKPAPAAVVACQHAVSNKLQARVSPKFTDTPTVRYDPADTHAGTPGYITVDSGHVDAVNEYGVTFHDSYSCNVNPDGTVGNVTIA